MRNPAEECRVIAEMMTEERTRQDYLDLACTYEALARDQEARGWPWPTAGGLIGPAPLFVNDDPITTRPDRP
ncbi:hypothetical protein LMTR13_05745 [Bradyrhizobium icense]|uniref:Uncharacterized protein n=1 Tax=Bradyrhizobium icense TaxID=1274631 RepID=A0A1B1UAR6_9BRAD|nr:hypothetical protein LMTR13_05745 [Bradyrhizobium icense]